MRHFIKGLKGGIQERITLLLSGGVDDINSTTLGRNMAFEIEEWVLLYLSQVWP